MLEVETTGVGCHWRGQGLGVKRQWGIGLVVGGERKATGAKEIKELLESQELF